MEIIVLGTTKTGDSSLVVHSLSREWGRRSFITSCKKGGAMALYLPLNILETEVVENRRTDLWRMNSTHAVYPLGGLRGNLSKNAMCMFMSEVLYRTLREGSDSEDIYEWCRSSILTLDRLESDYSNYHLRFLAELASGLGFSPHTTDLQPFAGERAELVERLFTEDLASAMLIPLNGKTRGEIADALVRYLGYHLDFNLNIRSLAVLGELFGSV